jgi:hypothetical protein
MAAGIRDSETPTNSPDQSADARRIQKARLDGLALLEIIDRHTTAINLPYRAQTYPNEQYH